MTLDELVVRVRVAVEEADGELDAVLSDLRRFAGEAAAAAGDAAAPQEALWAELAEAAKGAFSQVAEAVRAGAFAGRRRARRGGGAGPARGVGRAAGPGRARWRAT